MASFTKLIAFFSLAAAFAAGAPTPNTLAGREATKLDITTKDGQDFALVPVEGNYGKDVTVHLGPLPEELPEVHKREDASVDAVAYNPAYIYAYKAIVTKYIRYRAPFLRMLRAATPTPISP